MGNAREGGAQVPHYQKAFELLGDQGNVALRAQALIGLGNAARAVGKNREAISYYDQALALRVLSPQRCDEIKQRRELAERFLQPDAHQAPRRH